MAIHLMVHSEWDRLTQLIKANEIPCQVTHITVVHIEFINTTRTRMYMPEEMSAMKADIGQRETIYTL